jgi:HAD superfamily hydrolase (TIGR01509 family)
MNPEPLRLVIFDCDGVLVDSEGPSNRVIAQEVTALGYPMTEAESTRLFVGGTLEDIPPIVERLLGRPLPDGWSEYLRGRIIAAFTTVQTMPGAHDALRAVTALGLPFRVASNSSHQEMQAKFTTTGLDALIADRRHSANDVPRGKPAPDVFLHAAAAEGVPPAACVVIEDSIPGATAALAAGMTVIGLAPHGDAAALRQLGIRVIRHLSELPPLLADAAKVAA